MNSTCTYTIRFLFACTFLVCSFIAVAQDGPPGFAITQFSQRIPGRCVDMDFDAQNRMYATEKNGRVWVSMNGVVANNPLIDVDEEISSINDRGLLCFTLDPNFAQNGHFYVGYVMDRHHLFNFGTPNYDADSSEDGASIVRITRYTVTAASLSATNPDNVVVAPNSRKILIGETATTGIPVLDGSHSGIDLVFGTDGTLLVVTGDGAGLSGADKGGAGNPGYGSAYWQQALDDGIINFWQNVGSYRSQMIDSHCGKVLRIDPATGDGIASNPHYNAAQPRSARSRVFARGLRNPFRATLRPGTGSTNPADANPGSLYIADLGWSRLEELHIMKQPNQNFGWPYFEGLSFTDGQTEFYYHPDNVINNPNDSTQNIYYHHLPNPADSLANFSKASLVYGRAGGQTIRLEHDHGVVIPDLNLPYPNVTTGGRAIIGGGWTRTGGTLPAEYQNKYFFGDYIGNWIAYAEFDTDDHPERVEPFGHGFESLVSLVVNPNDNNLYTFFWFLLDPMKIEFTGNQTPKAVLTATPTYGPGPLSVAFNGAASSDPENTALSYSWDFGDGSPTSTAANPTHTYMAVGPQSFTATLTVTDGGGATAQATQLIAVNNTPPVVQSSSLDNLTLLNPSAPTTVNLSAVVTDAQTSANELTYRWQVLSMHNDHGHEGAHFDAATATVTLPPLGNCSTQETYWYRIVLTVTDPGGLQATFSRDLYPTCTGTAQTISFPAPPAQLPTNAPFRPTVTSSSGLPISLYVISGPAYMAGDNVRLTGELGTVRLRAAQHGNATYRPAFPVEQTVEVVSTITSAPTADLSLQLAVDKRAVEINAPVSAWLTVSNEGPNEVTNVAVSSRLPANLAFVGSPTLTLLGGGLVGGSIGTLPPGTSQTVEMIVLPSAPGTYRLAAQISAADLADTDSQADSGTEDGQDDAATVDLRTTEAGGGVYVSPNPNQVPLPPVVLNQPTPPANRVDLALQLAVSSRTPAVGQPANLSVLVSNAGGLTASSVVVRDTLWYATLSSSAHFSVIASTAQYSVIQATVGSLATGQSALLTATITPTAARYVRNAAQVWSVGGGNTPADADSTPGNGISNGEDDAAWIDWRAR